MGDKGDKNAARPPEGSLVETRCLIKEPTDNEISVREHNRISKYKHFKRVIDLGKKKETDKHIREVFGE